MNRFISGDDISVTATCNDFLLAGDIGGTNSRLALYRRQGKRTKEHNNGASADSEHSNIYKDNSSWLQRPLFAREYLNEDHLGDQDGTEEEKSDNDCDNVGQCRTIHSNAKKFVRRIIAPFLEECLHNLTTFAHNTTSKNRCDGIAVVCCLAVAGPVDTSLKNGTVTTSQRDSYLTGLTGVDILREYRCLHQSTNIGPILKACVIINDFVAQGYGCLSLSSTNDNTSELIRLDKNGSISPHKTFEPKLCVGAGTGFGSCYLVPTSTTATHNATSCYLCLPSEYGQTEWVPNTSTFLGEDVNIDQVRLWEYFLQQKRQRDESSRISVEDIVSGIGLANAYSCFSKLYPGKANPEVEKEFFAASDLQGKVVGERARECEICKRAIDAILIAYGTVIGSCAMAFLPTDGLYVTGGLLSNILKSNDANWERICNGDNAGSSTQQQSPMGLFLEAYRSKGRASFLLDDIPLCLVLAKDAGLRGAAVRAEMEFQD